MVASGDFLFGCSDPGPLSGCVHLQEALLLTGRNLLQVHFSEFIFHS